MTDALRALYQEVILDHYKRPRNWGRPAACDRRAEGHNPLCGDRITVCLSLDGDIVRDVRVEGSGCAISVASASLMSEAIKGRRVAEVAELSERFRRLVTGRAAGHAAAAGGNGAGAALGKLAVFAGVAQHPARVKCATLAWHALRAALENRPEPVSTE